MSVVLVLISVSLFIALGFLGAFIWCIKSGQYDDDYTPSVRILFENEIASPQKLNPLKPIKKTNYIWK
jgi:cbb3-type cytochrome oxidase maturation protein